MTIKGAELISNILTTQDVNTVFALAGASHTHLLDALDRDGVTIVSNRHESGAVGAADGYARIKRSLGVAMIVADQGLPNALGGLATAWHAQSPVLILVATPPRPFVEAETAIDQDKLALVTPISKWARTVPCVERLADYVMTAIKHALSGRPGPVVLLIPEDQLQASVQPITTKNEPLRLTAIQPSIEAIAAATRALAKAQRPLIITGAGATWSDTSAPLHALAHMYGIPVLGNSMGRGALAEDGDLGLSWPYGQIAAKHADCVLLVGVRLTQRLGLGLPPRFSADATFIQVDIEPRAFHRNRPTDIVIHGDAALALTALVDALQAQNAPRKDHQWLHETLAARRDRVAELKTSPGPAIHPLRLGREVNTRLSEDAIYVGDGADIQTWMYGAIEIKRARGFLDHYPMGAMGSGTALAVGAAAALKEVAPKGAPVPPVVLVTGDGSLGFYPAELHAASKVGLNLKVIVGNDGAWGTELHGQNKAIGRNINTELGFLPYEKLGEAFGLKGFHVADVTNLAATLDEAFAETGPVLVNVELDQHAGAELKESELVRMIMFSDILEGQSEL